MVQLLEQTPSQAKAESLKRSGQLILFLKELLGWMVQLEVSIEEEYAAILRHDIKAMELVGFRKQAESEALVDLYKHFQGPLGLSPDTLTHRCESCLQELARFPKKEVSVRMQELQSMADKVLPKLARFRNKIQNNHFTLQRLLANHIESYRFWHELATEEVAAYDQKGQKAARVTQPSHFSIKA